MRFEIGLRIEAAGAGIQRATATVVNPIEWPEQELKLLTEDAPSGVQIDIQRQPRRAQQMIIKIPGLTSGSSIVCTRTFEVTRWTQRIKLDSRSKLVALAPEQAKPLLLPSEGIEWIVRTYASLPRNRSRTKQRHGSGSTHCSMQRVNESNTFKGHLPAHSPASGLDRGTARSSVAYSSLHAERAAFQPGSFGDPSTLGLSSLWRTRLESSFGFLRIPARNGNRESLIISHRSCRKGIDS